MIYVLLADGFEEIEALTPVDYLRRAGLSVKMLGIGKKQVTGGHGITVTADEVLETVPGDAEMVIMPGGLGGVDGMRGSKTAKTLIEKAAKEARVSAICAAPTLLAEMGLLDGKKCICYPDMTEKLTAGGGIVADENVVCDGNLITSRGAGTSELFAFAIIEAMCGKPVAEKIRRGICAR